MKIACITWSYDEHQGISRCVVELTARLAVEHEVHVFAAESAVEPRPGVHVHTVALRQRRAHLNDWDFFFRAGRLLRSSRFDLVHAHFPVWAPTDLYTCHGLARMALRAWRLFPREARRDVPTLGLLPWRAQLPLYRYAARNRGTLIAAVSQKVRREAAEESGRSLAEIDVVPNAVDLRRFRPDPSGRMRCELRRAWGLRDDQFALLWVGNCLRRKGIRHALACLERLPPEVVLIAVGADSPESVPDLAPSIARLRASSRLRFCPVDSAIEPYYAAADALLFPSLYESFGLVVLEAMAMGLPVVTARTVGFAEDAIEDGVNGFAVDQPWDVDALAERIERMRAQPRLAREIAAAGRYTAQLYSWERYLRSSERLYEQALARRGPRRGRDRAA
jgi:UDP-glucose:(heptosyl)LPS alpha-1,3-glucosyltransferase